MKFCLHAADLSNPVRPFEVAKHWAICVFKEFHDQGDEELRLGIPFTNPMNDRKNYSLPEFDFAKLAVIPQACSHTSSNISSNIPMEHSIEHSIETPSNIPSNDARQQTQIGFIKYVVDGTWRELATLLPKVRCMHWELSVLSDFVKLGSGSEQSVICCAECESSKHVNGAHVPGGRAMPRNTRGQLAGVAASGGATCPCQLTGAEVAAQQLPISRFTKFVLLLYSIQLLE